MNTEPNIKRTENPEHVTAPRIDASGVSKHFRLVRGSRVLLHLLRPNRPNKSNLLQALEGVDVSVQPGEVVGLIGKNGGGKSTLLKIIGGLYEKDHGDIRLSGRALYLSGFSYGTNPYLTVRANMSLIGTVFGLRRKEIREKIPEIAAFAGLEDFLDVEAFKLSSGMTTRLNVSSTFFCMEHVKPDILLLDEVLSTGGDIEFQGKTMKKVESLVRGGASILLASHDLQFIERFCQRVIWLDRGKVVISGPARETIAAYIKAYG